MNREAYVTEALKNCGVAVVKFERKNRLESNILRAALVGVQISFSQVLIPFVDP